MHGLADELGKARRKHRAAKSNPLTEIAERPRPLGIFMNQLERRSDMWVGYRPEPAALSGTKRRDPGSEDLDEQDFRQS